MTKEPQNYVPGVVVAPYMDPVLQLFDRLDYWNSISKSFREANRPFLFDLRYTKSFKLLNQDYQALHAKVFDVIRNSLAVREDMSAAQLSSTSEILAAVNLTSNINIQKDLDSFVQIESLLVEVLRKSGLLPEICGIEFPVNIRVAHGNAPPGYLQNNFATDYVHSDIWADEPTDIVHGLIYLDGDLASTFMELYDCPESKVSEIESYRGTYLGGSHLVKECDFVSYKPEPGQIILFDGVCPHQTVRKGGGARVSLDFRLRRVDPYKFLDERWYRLRPSWSKYWYLPKPAKQSKLATQDFKQRSESELEALQASGQTEAYRGRLDRINREAK